MEERSLWGRENPSLEGTNVAPKLLRCGDPISSLFKQWEMMGQSCESTVERREVAARPPTWVRKSPFVASTERQGQGSDGFLFYFWNDIFRSCEENTKIHGSFSELIVSSNAWCWAALVIENAAQPSRPDLESPEFLTLVSTLD